MHYCGLAKSERGKGGGAGMNDFECDDCGKVSVDKPGDICSECQETNYMYEIQAVEEWCSSAALCLECYYVEGPDQSDLCGFYMMPLYMTKRKRKCKHYRPINEQQIEDARDFYNDCMGG